jgi:hypothetical protein
MIDIDLAQYVLDEVNATKGIYGKYWAISIGCHAIVIDKRGARHFLQKDGTFEREQYGPECQYDNARQAKEALRQALEIFVDGGDWDDHR